MDFGELRVTYVGNPRPAVDAARAVERENQRAARAVEREQARLNTAVESLQRQRSRALIQQFQSEERAAKRAADALIREQERVHRNALRLRQTPITGQAAGGGLGSAVSGLGGVLPGGGLLGRVSGSGGLIGAAAVSFGLAAKEGVEYKNVLDRLNRSFETLLGSEQAASAHLTQLRDFANRTPFEFEDVARASQRFQAMGIEAGKVVPLLTDIGNAVASIGGGSDEVDRVALAIAQINAKGRVMSQEMNQLSEVGIAGWRALQAETGKSREELMKMVEAGEVSADTFNRAFHRMYADSNAMQKQMQTLSGAMSTLKDKGKELLADSFTPLHTMIKAIAVELATASTNGYSFEKALVAAARAAGGLADNFNPDMWGMRGQMRREAEAKRLAGQTWGEAPSSVNIPAHLQYKPRISDEELQQTRNAEMQRAKEAYTAEIFRQQEEAQRKARQETERQADVLKRIAGDYAEASTRTKLFASDSLTLERALYKLSIGYDTLSEANQRAADKDINGLFSERGTLARNQAEEELAENLKGLIRGFTSEGTEVEKVNHVLAEHVRLMSKGSSETYLFSDALMELGRQARVAAEHIDRAAAMVKLSEQNQESMKRIMDINPLLPNAPTNIMGRQGGAPLDLSNVQVDYWKTYKESWHESLQYMREDGVAIFGDMFARIGEGWKGAAGGLVLDFANALNQMAAQAAASVVWRSILGIIGGAVAGGFGGGAPGAGGGIHESLHIGGYASGTPSAPSGLAWVGERGPELVAFRGGERVFNNADSQRMGGTVVNKTTIINYQPRVTPNSVTSRRSSREAFEALLGIVR